MRTWWVVIAIGVRSRGDGAWIPACAGMTNWGAGMTKGSAGMTKWGAGMTKWGAGIGVGASEVNKLPAFGVCLGM